MITVTGLQLCNDQTHTVVGIESSLVANIVPSMLRDGSAIPCFGVAVFAMNIEEAGGLAGSFRAM